MRRITCSIESGGMYGGFAADFAIMHRRCAIAKSLPCRNSLCVKHAANFWRGWQWRGSLLPRPHTARMFCLPSAESPHQKADADQQHRQQRGPHPAGHEQQEHQRAHCHQHNSNRSGPRAAPDHGPAAPCAIPAHLHRLPTSRICPRRRFRARFFVVGSGKLCYNCREKQNHFNRG